MRIFLQCGRLNKRNQRVLQFLAKSKPTYRRQTPSIFSQEIFFGRYILPYFDEDLKYILSHMIKTTMSFLGYIILL